jgi:hypothetical protein
VQFSTQLLLLQHVGRCPVPHVSHATICQLLLAVCQGVAAQIMNSAFVQLQQWPHVWLLLQVSWKSQHCGCDEDTDTALWCPVAL